MFHLANDKSEVLGFVDRSCSFWTTRYDNRMVCPEMEANAIAENLRSRSPGLTIWKVEEDPNIVVGKIAYLFYSKYSQYFELASRGVYGNVLFEVKNDRYILVRFNCRDRGLDRVLIDVKNNILTFAPGVSDRAVTVKIATGDVEWDCSEKQITGAMQIEKCAIAIADMCAIKLHHELEWLGKKLLAGAH